VVRENGPGRPRATPPTRTLASWPLTPFQLFISHLPRSLHPLRVDFRRCGRSCTRTGRVAPESPPLRARSLHGRQPSPSGFNFTFHTPCTRCRSISAGTVGCARERAGSPQIHPPCARSLHPLHRVRDCWKQADELAG